MYLRKSFKKNRKRKSCNIPTDTLRITDELTVEYLLSEDNKRISHF